MFWKPDEQVVGWPGLHSGLKVKKPGQHCCLHGSLPHVLMEVGCRWSRIFCRKQVSDLTSAPQRRVFLFEQFSEPIISQVAWAYEGKSHKYSNGNSGFRNWRVPVCRALWICCRMGFYIGQLNFGDCHQGQLIFFYINDVELLFLALIMYQSQLPLKSYTWYVIILCLQRKGGLIFYFKIFIVLTLQPQDKKTC